MPRLSKIGAAALAAFGWTTGAAAVSASYLQVAGGGGGGFIAGGNRGAGGGAGGFLTGTVSLNLTLSYTVTVGAGGTPLANGSNSTITGTGISITASVGGGAGGSQNGPSSVVGQNGGSGGGGPSQSGSGSNAAGTGTVGQGNDGAAGTNSGGQPFGCGGGGGAGAVGTLSNNPAGAGGIGLTSSISGTSTYYAGGGGGGTYAAGPGVGGAGGLGGGGTGGGSGGNSTSGTANLGGGGGGAEYSQTSGSSGGSGVVIISYVGAQQFGGGVVTSSGGNTIHTFTTSGTLSPLSSLTASYLIVAGGGGGSFGGAGAGGLLSGSSLTIDTNSIYAVTVGAGGAGQDSNSTTGSNGSNSLFSMVSTTAVGGGGGGKATGTLTGNSGGSGGGGGNSGAGGAGTSGQGNAGGTGYTDSATYGIAGGGGGASAVGQTVNAGSSAGGNGGAGTASSISGTSTNYAGGGGGGGTTVGSRAGGTGGAGGGGNGTQTGNASSGTAGTGGGGGGAGSATGNGGAGGSGIVIISYPGSTQQMAGGTVTVAGGNVIHTFTSSGYLTPIVLVNNSLRFRSSASARLTRTPASASNRKTYTISAWVKLGSLDSSSIGTIFCAGDSSTSTSTHLYFYLDQIRFYWGGAGGPEWRTTQVFRDYSAWYHIVAAVDTNQSVLNDKLKLYINGVQVTSWVSQNSIGAIDTQINNTVAHALGSNAATAQYLFDGYMTEFNFIDGQQLTPNSFGTSNGLGVWQPIRYGGSYGTNGFYLPFNAGTSSFAGLFNGSSQYLSLTANSSLQFGTGDFTVEGWYYQNGTVNYGNIFSTTLSFGTTGGLRLSTGPNNNTFQVATGGSGLFNASVAFSASRWNHFALVRSSGVTTLYQNGVSVGSASDSNSYTADTFVIGWVDGSGSSAYLLNGLLSNFRVVKGTAVYTANFTPSTSPLTAISGTSLLTLQNATIIDNSTNAFSITNNGTVTTGQTYPCSTALFNDQGPAGNNWTPNNISGQFGTTLDSMTDVPTLTSATAANYCVLNPINSYATALSNGNLKFADGSGNAYQAYGTIANPDITALSFYCEVTVDATYGVAIAPSTKQGSNSNTDRTGVLAYYSNGNKFNGTSSSSYGASFTSGDVIGIAMGGGAVTFYKNGVSQGVAFSGLTGSYMFGVWSAGSAGIGCSFNFGQRPFSYTPPTGFNRLNTFNLSTPTIGATASTQAGDYFNTVLYTGNGGSQSVTGVGFQPDWVWVKVRNSTQNHSSNDSVRGAGNYLVQNATAAERFQGEFDSFNSDGFSLTFDAGEGDYNASGKTYVAWNWRANQGTNVTNTDGNIISTVSANTTSGFSILTYTGNATSSSTVGHGLGTTPTFFIIKSRGVQVWNVYSLAGGITGNTILQLNSTDAAVTGSNISLTASSTTIGFGSAAQVNGSGVNFVAYCFAPVAGYSAMGSYTGNGSSDGPFIYFGFRPAYIIIKRTDAVTNWGVFDSKRSGYNPKNDLLYPNSSAAEDSGLTYPSDFVSNGYKIRDTAFNASGGTYIYMAFAESPFKYANAR